MKPFRRRFCTLLFAVLACAAPEAHGILLDWNSLSWTPGSLSNSFDIDPTKPGNDVTITFAHNQVTSTGSPFIGDFVTGIQTPAINSNLEGGRGPGVSSLNVAVDLAWQNRYITVTVTFSDSYLQGVQGVAFSLFDIDRNNGNLDIDEIRSISALAADGVTSVAPVISGVGSSIALSGSGLGQILAATGAAPDIGAGSSAGNATISFGSTGIKSFTFQWGVPSYNANGPSPMTISIGDINFTPVPEVNPSFIAGGVCLVGAAWAWRRRCCRAR